MGITARDDPGPPKQAQVAHADLQKEQPELTPLGHTLRRAALT